MLKLLRNWARRLAMSRPPDFLIGPSDSDPYLMRWWVIRRNKLFNIYLHRILHSDDDRALHDHPWVNCSLVLSGGYWEHTIAAGGVHKKRWIGEGALKWRWPRSAHLLELPAQPPLSRGNSLSLSGVRETWTLFFTGPVVRTWGFHCPERGWVPWQDFMDERDKGKVGRGCGEGA